MRYRILLSYMGTKYSGWQKQPGDRTVQQTLEETFSKILQEPVDIVGCGRTDAGVHGRSYVAHFDAEGMTDTAKVLYQVNSVLPVDIAVLSIDRIHDDFHARFDAVSRSYEYSIHYHKDPFLVDRSFYLNRHKELDQEVMHEVADLILKSNNFQSFSKTGSDNLNFNCVIRRSQWTFEEGGCMYSISANRFLRGMVRLLVGATLNAGLGKLSIEEISKSLENQIPLPLQWSVPAEGLSFVGVGY